MTEYMLIEREDSHDLQDAVNVCIAQGWEPQGGASVAIIKRETPHSYEYIKIFTQAMIRKIRKLEV